MVVSLRLNQIITGFLHFMFKDFNLNDGLHVVNSYCGGFVKNSIFKAGLE